MNFLQVSEPEAAELDAQAYSQAQAAGRARTSSNALQAQYGPAYADPAMAQTAVAANTDQQIAPLKVQQAQLEAGQNQRADQAAQAQHAVAFIRSQVDNGVDPATAIGNLTPETYAALGVQPAQVAPLVAAVKANPKLLDQIGDALAPIAAKSTLVGQPTWAKDASGNYHMLAAMQDAKGNLSFSEPTGLPAGMTLIGGSPAQLAAANDKAVTSAQKAAEYSTGMGSDEYFSAVKAIFPNAIETGGARTPARNAAVGGAPNSMHLTDHALDFTVPGVDSATVFSKIRAAGLPVTEALSEASGDPHSTGPHLHVGWAPKASTTQADERIDISAARLKLAAEHEALTAANTGANISPQTVDYLAQQFRTTGKLPAMGMGGAGLRAQIFGRAAQMATAEGASGQADAYTAQATHERGTAVNDLGKSTPGSAGGRVQSANALITHLDQLSGLAGPLTSGQLPIINQAKQAYMQATGSAAPTNFNAVKQIAADEAVKFIVANGGTLHDREQAQAAFNAAQSPQQLQGAITQVQHLASGQLAGMRQRYTAIGAANDFDSTLTPRTRQLLGVPAPLTPVRGAPPPAPGAAPAAAPNIAALRAKYGL